MKSGLLEPEPCDTGGGFVVNCEVRKYIVVRLLYLMIHLFLDQF